MKNSDAAEVVADGFLTKAEAAKFVGVSQCLLDLQRRAGQLVAFKIGAKVLFRREDLCAWVLRHREDRS